MESGAKNREIFFRGKFKGKWEYGFLSYSEHSNTYYIGSDELKSPVDPNTIGQYTSRKSDSGKNIFEDDIVQVDDSGVGGLPHEMKAGTYKVVWELVSASFMLEQLDGKDAIQFDEVCEYTVLGNIYDNPELLGKEVDYV